MFYKLKNDFPCESRDEYLFVVPTWYVLVVQSAKKEFSWCVQTEFSTTVLTVRRAGRKTLFNPTKTIASLDMTEAKGISILIRLKANSFQNDYD